MPQSDVAALLTNYPVAKTLQMSGSDDPPVRRAAASCDFDRDQFILCVVKLHQTRVMRAVFKVK